jgi:hypothetical protein
VNWPGKCILIFKGIIHKMVNYYFCLKREKSKVNRPPSIAFRVGLKRTQSTIVGLKNSVSK